MNLFKILVLISFYITLFADAPMENLTLQLQWKNQFEFAGYYAATEKGFYKDAGLHVEFRELQKGEDIIKEVVAGDAQYGLAYSSLIAEYMKGKPIVFIANFFKQSPLVLITQKNIKMPYDLKGKRIMGISNNIHNLTLLNMLNKFDVKLSDVVDVPTNFKMDDFINKKVDAMSVFTTNEIYILDKKGIKYNVFDPVSFGSKYYDQNLFTTKSELLAHPDRVEKFKSASIKGWEYALSHKEEIVDLILKKYNTQHKSKDALLFEAKQVEQIMLSKVYPIGSIDLQRVQMIADNFVEAGFIKKGVKLDLKNFIFRYNTHSLPLTDQEIRYLAQKKEIRVCIDPKWMPFEAFDKDKHYVGMSSEFLKIFSDEIGLPLHVIKTDTWSESLEFTKQKKCDILSLVMETPERKTYLSVTKPYVKVPLALATKPDVMYIDTLSSLNGKKIGIVKGYAFDEILRKKYPNIKIVEAADIDDGLRAVVDGKVFGFIGTIADIGYQFQTKFTGELKISGKFDEKLELGIGVQRSDKTLFDIFSKLVDALTIDQERKIFNKYIAVNYQKGFDYALFWKFLTFGVFIVIILSYRHYIIDKLNRELKKASKDELERSRGKDRIIFHQSKLIAMGEMIENIAHQWRQPLSQVNSAVLVIDEQIYRSGIKNETIEKKLLEIENLTKYMSQTIDDFKNFFDLNKTKEQFSLNDLVRKSLIMREGVLHTHNIDIITIFEDTIISYGYPNELQQVLTVILDNAKDILVHNKIMNPMIKIQIKQSEKCDHIIICDNGGGVRDDIKEKIFEPYFTTKHKRQGSGIGLYMSKIIIEESLGGELKINNSDKGACFEIILIKEENENE